MLKPQVLHYRDQMYFEGFAFSKWKIQNSFVEPSPLTIQYSGLSVLGM